MFIIRTPSCCNNYHDILSSEKQPVQKNTSILRSKRAVCFLVAWAVWLLTLWLWHCNVCDCVGPNSIHNEDTVWVWETAWEDPWHLPLCLNPTLFSFPFFALLSYSPPCDLYYFPSIYPSSFWLNNRVVAHSVTAAFIRASASRFPIKYRHKHSWKCDSQWCAMKNTSKGYLKWHAVLGPSLQALRLILIMNRKGAEYLIRVWSDTTISSQRGRMAQGARWIDECTS